MLNKIYYKIPSFVIEFHAVHTRMDGIPPCVRYAFLEFLKLEYGSQFDALVQEFTDATTMENKMKVVAKFKSMLGPDNPYDRDYRFVKDKVNFKCKLGSEGFRTAGNEAYRKGNKFQAVRLYSQSIANAPIDSVELALAYANRSAVLRSMKNCRECLVDIERALSHGYPTDKSFKLLLRELQCHRDLGNMLKAQVSRNKAIKLLQSLPGLTEEEKANLKEQLNVEINQASKEVCTEEVIFPTEVPELSYGANPEILGASSAVKLEYNEQQGRHLVAARDIEIGDVLLMAENLVVAVKDGHNEKCQKEANQKYHNTECAPYSRFRQMTDEEYTDTGDTELLFERVFRLFSLIGIHNLKPYLKYARTDINQESSMTNEEKRTKGFNADGVFDPNNFDTIFNLSYEFRGSPTDILINSLTPLKVPCCFGMSESDPDFFAVVGLYVQLEPIAYINRVGKFYINFDYSPITYTIAAVSFNPLYSLLNHSCAGCNTTQVEYGNKRVVMARWPIPKGTILTDSYVVIYDWSKEERQEHLKEECAFDCKCVPCEENWNFEEKSKISDPEDRKKTS
ncbi:hypothetical protein B566_EDAN013130 [Ephemera danica]|nr:hypothetical protein B566_EDAN013130 [Ephemera danica]